MGALCCSASRRRGPQRRGGFHIVLDGDCFLASLLTSACATIWAPLGPMSALCANWLFRCRIACRSEEIRARSCWVSLWAWWFVHYLWWFHRRMGRKSVASKSPTRLRTTQHAGLTHDLPGRLMAAMGVASRSLPLDRLRQSGQQRDAQRRRAEAQRNLVHDESVDQFFV